jgi:hypothetical protein
MNAGLQPVLQIRIRDTVHLIHGPGIWDKPKKTSRNISQSLVTIFWLKILILFVKSVDFRDEKIQIREKHPGSTTLPATHTVPAFILYSI